MQGKCAFEADNVIKLLTFEAVQSNMEAGADRTELSARLADLVKDYAGGEFSLFYANCQKLAVVSFDIRVALYNVRGSGTKDFLSVGEDMLPTVYMVGPSLALWILSCAQHRPCSTSPHAPAHLYFHFLWLEHFGSCIVMHIQGIVFFLGCGDNQRRVWRPCMMSSFGELRLTLMT